MINTKELEKIIVDKGIKKKYLAKELGLSDGGFWKKLTGRTEFVASETRKLCNILDIDERKMVQIFFSDHGDFKSRKN